MEMVRDPRALCVSSRQFLTLGLANQLEHVLAAFPSAISHNRVFDAMSTREALTREKKVDIVHIAAFVCPRSGTLYFSDVDLRTGKPSSDAPRDTIKPDDLEPVTKLHAARILARSACYFAGTRAFSSSNQLSTTLSSRTSGCTAFSTNRNRLPSGNTA